ncbi:MAG: hypothetical protein KJ666_15185 [Bacteroidetes bacterium]|nr:hypothetical protein [Bacteroidota bacterium]
MPQRHSPRLPIHSYLVAGWIYIFNIRFVIQQIIQRGGDTIRRGGH